MRIKLTYEILVAVGAPEFTEPQKAVHFLKRLDPNRYGAFMADLYNRAGRRQQLPQTLYEAQTGVSIFYVQKGYDRFTPGEHAAYVAIRG